MKEKPHKCTVLIFIYTLIDNRPLGNRILTQLTCPLLASEFDNIESFRFFEMKCKHRLLYSSF